MIAKFEIGWKTCFLWNGKTIPNNSINNKQIELETHNTCRLVSLLIVFFY